MESPLKTNRLNSEIKETHRRGKPTQVALYDLHKNILTHKEQLKKQKADNDILKINSTKVVNSQSEIIRITGFKKEFGVKLAAMLNSQV